MVSSVRSLTATASIYLPSPCLSFSFVLWEWAPLLYSWWEPQVRVPCSEQSAPKTDRTLVENKPWFRYRSLWGQKGSHSLSRH